jgi:catechol 2,3-dioxygenase-like lactoylglutathione lyase family enzyme
MITKVRLTAVTVSEQDRAVDFYVNQLGFALQADHTMDDGNRWIEVVPPGAETALTLHTPAPEHSSAAGGRTDVVFATDDMEATHQELAAKGVNFVQAPQRHIWGDMMAIFADPDGNTFLLVDRP